MVKSNNYFYFDPVQSQAIYTQGHNGIPIADGTASVTFHFDSNHDILAYDQSYAGELQPQGRNLILISEKRLWKFYSRIISSLQTHLYQNPGYLILEPWTLKISACMPRSGSSRWRPVTRWDILRVDAATGSVLPSNVSAATHIPSEEADLQNNQQ